MDILLFLIIFIIVLVIGYILSRPFLNAEPLRDVPYTFEDYKLQYQLLLNEIKTLESECNELETPEERCGQIELKKELAANLLRLIHPSGKNELASFPITKAATQLDTQPEQRIQQEGSKICPQCGNQVKSSDKFCIQCGYRPQP